MATTIIISTRVNPLEPFLFFCMFTVNLSLWFDYFLLEFPSLYRESGQRFGLVSEEAEDRKGISKGTNTDAVFLHLPRDYGKG
jgi:hypothetical protein